MIKTRFTALDALTVLTVAGLAALAIGIQVAGPTIPLPMHFDIHGQPDRWGDRSELSGLIAFMAFMAAITAGPMSWYAKRAPDAARRRGLEIGQLVSLLAIVGTSAFMIWMILGRGASQTGVSLTMSAALMSLLFFGGWLSPIPGLPDGAFWMVLKMAFFFFLFAMVKAIVPRYRYDQLMRIGWKVFLPMSLGWVVLVAFLAKFEVFGGFWARWAIGG